MKFVILTIYFLTYKFFFEWSVLTAVGGMFANFLLHLPFL